MGKRYYCDYCDRSFKDDPEARKKHLSSLPHARNRVEHYVQYKDAATILSDESAKTPCKRFMVYGNCSFGNGCRFSHYTRHMLWELECQVSAKKYNSEFARVPPRPEEVIREFFHADDEDKYPVEQSSHTEWQFPIELQNYPNLPPSLWPITPHTVTDSNFARWGL